MNPKAAFEPSRRQATKKSDNDSLFIPFKLSSVFLSVHLRLVAVSAVNRRKFLVCLLGMALAPVFAINLLAQEIPAPPPPIQTPSAPPSDPPGKSQPNKDWTYKKFLRAFKRSGRETRLTAQEFARLQVRKQAYLKDIRHYLWRKFGGSDPRIMRAFQELPREYFHYEYQGKSDFCKTAYEFPPRTWGLGWGSALSDYEGQAYMAQLAHPTAKDRVLEIGTGSGFNIALLSRVVKDAYSIEIIKPLGQAVSHIFKPLGYTNVHTRVGDGYYGWKDVNGFDIIMFTCTAQFVPPPLFKQLRPGGRIIIPIGQPFKHNQVLYVYHMDKRGRVHSKKYIPVYFIPMRGTMGIAAVQMGITVPGLKKAKHPRTKPIPGQSNKAKTTSSSKPAPAGKRGNAPRFKPNSIHPIP